MQAVLFMAGQEHAKKLCIICHNKKLMCMVGLVPVSQALKWKCVEGSEMGDPRVEKRVQVMVEEFEVDVKNGFSNLTKEQVG